MTLSNNNRTATHIPGIGWSTSRSSIGKNKGKWYFEVANDTDGDAMWGFTATDDPLNVYPGNVAQSGNSMGWEANLQGGAVKFQNGNQGATSNNATVPAGGWVNFHIDFDTGRVWVKNSTAAGYAGGGDPATGTTPTFTITPGTHLYPTISAYSGPQAATVNFGTTSFKGSPAVGYNIGWYGQLGIKAPTFISRFDVASINDSQAVAASLDGTSLWVTSSSKIHKYNKTTGALITSRDCTGDNPTTKSQINGIVERNGVLYVSAAENSTPRKSWIVEYDAATLNYIAAHPIPGDWFSEGVDIREGDLWVCFHAHRIIARINISDWTIKATYPLTFRITGSSGGFGSGTGYDGITWIGDYLLCNIHEIYDQNEQHVYYWNGMDFEEVQRFSHLTNIATQGIALDPTSPNTIWYTERISSGDSIAKATLV